MSDYRDFWNVPLKDVPYKTGAVNAVGLNDLKEVIAGLDVTLWDKKVLDVGCGTGRLADICGEYTGVDIAPSQVEYAQAQGRKAYLIGGPQDIYSVADIICCFSVFTHIPRAERQVYLRKFASLAPKLLVDILPGSEGGHIPAWYADVESFEADLIEARYCIKGSFVRFPAHHHRYFYAEL